MEKKTMIVLCIILMFSIIGGVHCRALRTEQINGCDQTTVESGGFGFFSAANSSSDHLPLMRNLAFRLASGPSKRGRGH
ncbi:unnamed protein product [Cochlearia groenlandica]